MNVDIKDVPFRGGSATKAAVVAGQVDVGMMSIQHFKGYESKMRVLGLFAHERDARFPSIRTFDEQGLDIPTVISPFGVYVRSETPDDIVLKLQTAVQSIVETGEYKDLIKKAGLTSNYHDERGARNIVDEMYVILSN
jgi:tripartite-type tricarboxylate transporter receptor subunit TctC